MSYLKVAHDLFLYGDIDIDDVVSWYRLWLKQIFYVVCCRFNYSKEKYEYALFRGLKRGDDRYNSIVCRKFDRLYDLGRDLSYFSFGSRGYVRGSGLHIVLEYDANKYSLLDAWLRVGADFNRFMSRIYKKYGKVSKVRVWESHKSGYPHIHVILIFHNRIFAGYSSRRRGRFVYRIFGHDYENLKAYWEHGYSDIQLISSFSGGIRYLSKYLEKGTSARFAGIKDIRGLAMCWVFRKRSFSVSGSLFVGMRRERSDLSTNDVIWHKSNSNLNSFSDGSFILGKSFESLRGSFLKNSEDVFVRVGIDLFGNSIFEVVGRWHLFGFCLCDVVLWSDWRMHFVRGCDLVCKKVNNFDYRRNYYEVVC